MITKEEVAKKINEAIITEENAIILYSQHLKTILLWSGVSKEDQAEIKDSLKILIDESAGHKKIFTSLKNEIEKEDKNVF